MCWERYGYKKTSIAELASLVGISTGAFYAFYSTKELLFMETADFYSDQILNAIMQNVPKNPTKCDLAEAVKILMEELGRNKWMLSMQQDFELFMHRLPQDFLKKNQSKDLIDITEIVRQFGLVPKVSMEEITAVMHTLSVSVYFTEMIGEYYKRAMGFLIDGVIERLFE
jgi:AcrR family transcriptional regulator